MSQEKKKKAPKLALIENPSLQDLVELYTLMSGKEPTPEELASVKEMWERDNATNDENFVDQIVIVSE